MAIEIKMPQLSDTMDSGTILSWLKKEGDVIGRGDALAEVATDKADLEIESFHEGMLLKIYSPEGSTVQVGEVIALVGEAGESVAVPEEVTPEDYESTRPTLNLTPEEKEDGDSLESAQAQDSEVDLPIVFDEELEPKLEAGDTRVRISPLAKSLAESHEIDFSSIQGTGEGGRIVRTDIEEHLESLKQAAESPVAGQGSGVTQNIAEPVINPSDVASSRPTLQMRPTTQTLSKMRSAIASSMVKSTTTIPHFYVTSKINVDALMKMRGILKALPEYEGITYTHLIIKASALALRKVPRINSVYNDNTLIEHGEVNIGIITALEDGLLIPVVKGADAASLVDVVSESRALVQRARVGKPKSDDLVGSTFAISNMGRFEVESFTAIVNPNNAAILAVSAISEEPVVQDGKLEIGNVMRLTLSVDHRIIDGLVAGEFLTELKSLLEDPVLLLA